LKTAPKFKCLCKYGTKLEKKRIQKQDPGYYEKSLKVFPDNETLGITLRAYEKKSKKKNRV